MGKYYTEKRRYKLYKAKKRWVSAAIITASGTVLFLSQPQAQAAETSSDTGTETLVTQNENSSNQETQSDTSALTNSATTTVTNTTNTEVATTTTTAEETTPTTSTTPVTQTTSSETQTSTTQTATTTQVTTQTDTSATTTPPTTQKDHVKGNVEAAWQQGYQGQGMVVAVIDSGADTAHKDFQQAPQTPAISSEAAQEKINELGYGSYVSEKFPFVYNYASKSNTWVKDDGPDASQHGQHVAGIIGATGQPNGDSQYAVGVAPESQLLALRVFNDQFADENTDDIAQAIYDAVKLGANVIQMSLGQGVANANFNDAEQKAVQYAIDHGVFVSISASNSGHAGSVKKEDALYSPGGANGSLELISSSTIANPAASRNALTVAAENSETGAKNSMASFSSWGPLPDFTLKPDLAAPGYQIVSTGNDNKYLTMSGTSMAGPFAAGAATLVMQHLKQETDLTNADLVQATKALLMNTAKPMPDLASGTYISPRRQGAGQIDVGAAVASPVYITASDNTSAVSLHQVGESTTFELTFTNLSSTDQTYTFDDFGGGFTEVLDELTSYYEVLDELTSYYYEEQLAGARITGSDKITVKAGQTLTVPYTLNLTGLKQNQIVEGWLRFTGDNGQETLVVPFLSYYGDLTSEDVLDKPANDETNAYGGNYFVNEANYPRGIADEESLKKLVNLDGNYDWQQVAKLYQDGKVAFSPNNDGKSDLLKPLAFVKQNLKDLKVMVLDQNRRVVRVIADEQGLDKSIYSSGSNRDVSLSVSMRNDPNTLDWDGLVYNDATGEFVAAPDGEYTYRYVATLYNEGPNQVQSADYPVIIDTTAPTIESVSLQISTETGATPSGTLSFDYRDTGAGFTDYSYAVITINGQMFGHKLNDGADSNFSDDTKMAGTVKFALSADELNAFTNALNSVNITLSDVADNVQTYATTFKPVQVNDKTINVWNATDGLGFNESSPSYDATTKTYQLTGGATTDFYYNGSLVQVIDFNADSGYGYYIVPVDATADKIVFTADKEGKDVILTLNTATPKAQFAWQKAHTIVQNFGIDLDTVTANDPNKVTVYAAVTQGDNVKAYAKDYFTGAIYEGVVKDGLATFEIKVTKASRRTVLLGWTEIAGPTFNVVQKTDANEAYLGVDARASNQAQDYSITSATELGVTLTNENADPKTLGAPGALPGHALTNLTTRSEPNSEISFDQLEDNNYNWLNLADVSNGLYDVNTKTFTVTGKVSSQVTSLVILGQSSDEQAPQNKVTLNSDGTFSYQFQMEKTQLRPLAYIYTTADGSTTRGTIELILDTELPTLSFESSAFSQTQTGDTFELYTNQPTLALSGVANDNLDGYRFFLNGDNLYRELHNSGVNQGGNPYAPYTFATEFDLTKGGVSQENGATFHVYTLEVVDVVGNTKKIQLKVYYQPQTATPNKVVVDQPTAQALINQYPAATLEVLTADNWHQVEANATKAEQTYRLVDKYGNVLSVFLIKEAATKQQLAKPDTDQNTGTGEGNQNGSNTGATNDQAGQDQTGSATTGQNGDAKKENTGGAVATGTDTNVRLPQHSAKTTTAPLNAIVANQETSTTIKGQVSTNQQVEQLAANELPQTGEQSVKPSLVGVILLGLAGFLSLIGLKPKKD